jgi:hypothetical protein
MIHDESDQLPIRATCAQTDQYATSTQRHECSLHHASPRMRIDPSYSLLPGSIELFWECVDAVHDASANMTSTPGSLFYYSLNHIQVNRSIPPPPLLRSSPPPFPSPPSPLPPPIHKIFCVPVESAAIKVYLTIVEVAVQVAGAMAIKASNSSWSQLFDRYMAGVMPRNSVDWMPSWNWPQVGYGT